mmetsp:Transcript_6434/g.15927  ORF Transcript_6434/g.15927 Transcript_6434/m.15927 type:complete len:663 (+) Transcript_6434:456-2444(+)|eukprot:CAMPEP_0197190384 /NCGR_PEP_ID=MMETSP1423-20130617/21546_1 /TAXON_ID=476441 /ORGANISM="Pseudo-nitzschia heimii, Strain UNC1101" /LENGTH=662 /DNA_ID=CAMNT_0042642755 /DNA_START=402 /DNA_END=2390 /DNA_ORIENTATION=-
MGTYLSTPVTEKCEESGEALEASGDRPMEWGVVDMQGWRKSMEDAHTAVTSVPMKSPNEINGNRNARVFGVYDGHGGPEVARFCQYYFVSVLTHTESWIDHDTADNCLPLDGDDPRIPPAPPAPTENLYDGNGNERGYRFSHLPAAKETPIGKALRQAFHSMDRMVDDPSRRNEIIALRTVKPEKGATKTLQDGVRSIPPIPTTTEAPPDFYARSQVAAADSSAVTSVTNTGEAAVEEPSSLVSSPVDTGGNNPESEKQADRSLSLVMDPEEANALKDAVKEFEQNSEKAENSDNKVGTKEDDSVDSNEPVGQEEAAALDDNIYDADGDGTNVEATPSVGAPNGGKVTTMLQKILSLRGTSDANASSTNTEAKGAAGANEEKKEPQPVTPAPAELLVNSPKYPDSSEVTGTSPSNPSVLHNGRLVCNLPDHPIHAGATAVVAIITGNILTVANAGDSRAVLCRRRKISGAEDNKTKGHYAYPMSYDHKPSQMHEMNRILRSGGFVNHFGRINGNLNLSRSIGDLKYKQVPGIPPAHQMITAEPDIMQIVLEDGDEFLMLGCDGIWDCLSNENAVDFVMNRIDSKSPTEIGAEMLDQIISDDPRVTQGIGGDNMTIMIVDLKAATRSRKKISPSIDEKYGSKQSSEAASGTDNADSATAKSMA